MLIQVGGKEEEQTASHPQLIEIIYVDTEKYLYCYLIKSRGKFIVVDNEEKRGSVSFVVAQFWVRRFWSVPNNRKEWSFSSEKQYVL